MAHKQELGWRRDEKERWICRTLNRHSTSADMPSHVTGRENKSGFWEGYQEDGHKLGTARENVLWLRVRSKGFDKLVSTHDLPPKITATPHLLPTSAKN